jgi:hypothetical protein
MLAGRAQLGQDQHPLLVLQVAKRARPVPGEQARRRGLDVTDQDLGRGPIEAKVDEQRVHDVATRRRDGLGGRARGADVELAEKQPGEFGVLGPVLDDQQGPHAAAPTVPAAVCERKSRTTTALT